MQATPLLLLSISTSTHRGGNTSPEIAPQSHHRRNIGLLLLLNRLPHINPDNFIFPPKPDGWQTINGDELRARGRDDKAIELLRHLPYLRNRGLRPQHTRIKNNITDDSLSIAYCDGELEPDYVHEQQPTPGHVIWLLTQDTKEGSYLLLDIESGTITTWNPVYPGPSLPNQLDEDSLRPIDRWMNYATLPVGNFFDLCARCYERLIWITVPGLRENNSRGTAHHYERIMNRGIQDDYLYSDDDYDAVEDGSSSNSDSAMASGEDGEEGVVSSEEVDQLMEDAGADVQWSSAEFSYQPVSGSSVNASTGPRSEDGYQTDVAYEDVSADMKTTWKETRETYYIYKDNLWPAIDYDRTRCILQLRDWLDAKLQRAQTNTSAH